MHPARVLVLYTGGTIGMVPVDPERPDGTRRPGSKDDVLRYIPGIGVRDNIEWELLADPALPPIDSSDVRPSDWLAMAAILEREYARYDGFVILHGTDTMAYSASALSFLCENLAKPIIFTGSQTPLFHDRTDGRLNLIHALRLAGHRTTGLPLLPDVAICFGKRVVRGNRARKMSTTDSDAFDSPNLRPLGAIETDVFLDPTLLSPRPPKHSSSTKPCPPASSTSPLSPECRPRSSRRSSPARKSKARCSAHSAPATSRRTRRYLPPSPAPPKAEKCW